MPEQRFTADFWHNEIQRAVDKREQFVNQFSESIKVYNTRHEFDDAKRRLNVWWYIVNTLLPAYYSRTPKPECRLRKKTGNDIYRRTALAIERAVQYEIEECLDFQRLGIDFATAFLLGGQCVGWVRYEPELGDTQITYAETTENSVKEVTEALRVKLDEKTIIEPIHYRDYIESPARNRREIEWKGRKAYMSKESVTKEMGADVAEQLKYDSYPEEASGDQKDPRKYEGKAILYEIWNEEQGKVYWLSENRRDFLEVSDPPLKFKDFYPCESLEASCDPDSNTPVSDYIHCRDQIMQVEQTTTRMFSVLRAIRSNFAYDATTGDTLGDLLEGDLKMVPVKNWPSYKARGGLSNMLEGLPIEGYIRALEVLGASRNEALQQLYETTKAADILRGMADPQETATAVQLRADWGSLGLKIRQQQFAEFIGRLVSKVGEVVCEHYSPEKIAAMCDAESLVMDAPPGTWEQIVSVMRDDAMRRYRIEVSTDSLVALDERADRQERTDLVASVGSFFGQIVPMIEQYPAIAPMSLELVKYVTRSYRAGKELESVITACVQAVGQAAVMKQQQQAQQPPQPGAIEAQARMQIAQINAQMDTQKLELEKFNAQLDAQIKNQEMLIETERLKLEQAKAQMEAALAQQELQLKAAEISKKEQQDVIKAELETRAEALKAMMEKEKLEMERVRVQLETYEKLLEEKRLSLQAMGGGKNTNVTVSPYKPWKKKSTITRPDGKQYTVESEDLSQ